MVRIVYVIARACFVNAPCNKHREHHIGASHSTRTSGGDVLWSIAMALQSPFGRGTMPPLPATIPL